MKKLFVLAIAAVMAVAAVSAGSSNMAFSRASVKAGYNFDAKAFQVGGDLNLGTLGYNLYVVPQLEIIFAEGVTPVALDASLQYYLPTHGTIRPYIGGGPGIMFGGGSTDFKLHVIGGLDFNIINSRMTFFTECKVRFIEGSDFGIMAGLSFKL